MKLNVMCFTVPEEDTTSSICNMWSTRVQRVGNKLQVLQLWSIKSTIFAPDISAYKRRQKLQNHWSALWQQCSVAC